MTARVVARGIGGVAVVVVGLCASTAAGSALVGVAAGIPVARAVSGGLIVVGSLVFAAGAATGLREPRGARRRWSEETAGSHGPAGADGAFTVSVLLLAIGLGLVVLGVMVHPGSTP